jgi:hypothetical protein
LPYTHSLEGPDDMPGNMSSLFQRLWSNKQL